MTHYVCSGDCGGESETPKLCDAADCTKEGEPLTACNCSDGLHVGIVNDAEEEIDVDEEIVEE
jgi:hypothetical protein